MADPNANDVADEATAAGDEANAAGDSLLSPRQLQTTTMRLVAVQAVCIVDHVLEVSEETLHQLVGEDVGGSRPCSSEQLQELLASVGDFQTKAGGSSSNVARNVSAGFGLPVALVGAGQAKSTDVGGGLRDCPCGKDL